MKILFLVKGNSAYSYGGAKSGLIDSAKLTSMQLIKYVGAQAKVVVCIDGNDVDREVTEYSPDLCIIEALWVTPEKMEEIAGLHPNVKFYIRVHSEIPFLATEGIAINWLKRYVDVNKVFCAFNSEITAKDFSKVVESAVYLPNIYNHIRTHSGDFLTENVDLQYTKKEYVDIASFGALRPMKDQLIQAFAAIEYGNTTNKTIHFNINGGRMEQGGEEVLKNMRSLFEGTRHKLIEHEWLLRGEFLELISYMDLGLQLSFSESFNIVCADFVRCNVPIIVSDSIRWMPAKSKVKIDVAEIGEKINHVLHFSDYYVESGKKALNNYNKEAIKKWQNFLNAG